MDLGRDFTFVDGLLAAIANTSSKIIPQQQVACIYTLKTLLLRSGEQLYDTSLEAYTPTPLPNMLAGIHDDLHQHLKVIPFPSPSLQNKHFFFHKTRAQALCAKLLADANGPNDSQATPYSSYKVKKRFTLHRVALLDILVELADENPTDVLGCIEPQIWRVLSDWLFDHKYVYFALVGTRELFSLCSLSLRFNNVYHNLFFKLFKAVLKSGHVESMKSLFSKYKFVSKMVPSTHSSLACIMP